mmetsp:Transcript_33883/g.97408  ORF Transcript_33883/g.97408 Transcript_33883/m.97408 type:complete len:202 (+) Transcript_33883:742-1347(+)
MPHHLQVDLGAFGKVYAEGHQGDAQLLRIDGAVGIRVEKHEEPLQGVLLDLLVPVTGGGCLGRGPAKPELEGLLQAILAEEHLQGCGHQQRLLQGSVHFWARLLLQPRLLELVHELQHRAEDLEVAVLAKVFLPHRGKLLQEPFAGTEPGDEVAEPELDAAELLQRPAEPLTPTGPGSQLRGSLVGEARRRLRCEELRLAG